MIYSITRILSHQDQFMGRKKAQVKEITKNSNKSEKREMGGQWFQVTVICASFTWTAALQANAFGFQAIMQCFTLINGDASDKLMTHCCEHGGKFLNFSSVQPTRCILNCGNYCIIKMHLNKENNSYWGVHFQNVEGLARDRLKRE